MNARSAVLIACTLLLPACAATAHGAPRSAASAAQRAPAMLREAPFVVRPFRPFSGPRWIGEAVAYGPHRDGQHPGGPAPSRAELREDLRLMSGHWSLLRLYNSVGAAEKVLQIIRADRLDMKVVLGVWIAPEERADSTGRVLERFPEARAANRRETESAIRLAAAYPEIVTAVSVGNETQIFWSAHRVPAPLVVKHVRQVRAGTVVPVTVADDFNFWNKPESRDMADEVDFILTHAHPLWNGRALEDAVDWTRSTVEQVRAMHPGRLVVLGETGWATQMIHEGEQGRLIRGRTGEAEQAVFRAALSEWIRRDSVTTFLFEAFDENWKGGSHPGEVEKHWGLFRADRTPKPALRRADRP